METLSTVEDNYSSLKEDPQFLLTLVHKFVKVAVIKDVFFSGYLIAIDPEQYSAVLAVTEGYGVFKSVLIPGHTILNISEETPPENKVFLPTQFNVSSEDNLERKSKLISWFKKNLLPVSEIDENIAIGNALILPPYSHLDICIDNPIVANQIKGIILKMPDDFIPS